MRKIALFIMLLLPALVLGQTKNSGQDPVFTDAHLDKEILRPHSNFAKNKMATTLIDDRNFYKSQIDFELNKSYDLSFNPEDRRLLNLFVKPVAGENLFKVDSSLDLNWKLRPIEPLEDLQGEK